FRFLKDPMFVNALFLKTPKRVQALGYVILLAVMIASLLELRIRNALKEQRLTITAGPRKNLTEPTARVLLNLLNEVQVVYLEKDGQMNRILPSNTDPEILKLLRLSGYDETIYTKNPYRSKLL
ncbi:MAG: transposase, partial [Firmicutes bacterium]|nr:transposase [Bacillota bacterium]